MNSSCEYRCVEFYSFQDSVLSRIIAHICIFCLDNISEPRLHDAASFQFLEKSSSLQVGIQPPAPAAWCFISSLLRQWECWGRKDINWVMQAAREASLRESTQQHCCFNPTGARLLPGNLRADSDPTPPPSRSGFLGQIQAVRCISNAERDGSCRLKCSFHTIIKTYWWFSCSQSPTSWWAKDVNSVLRMALEEKSVGLSNLKGSSSEEQWMWSAHFVVLNLDISCV